MVRMCLQSQQTHSFRDTQKSGKFRGPDCWLQSMTPLSCCGYVLVLQPAGAPLTVYPMSCGRKQGSRETRASREDRVDLTSPFSLQEPSLMKKWVYNSVTKMGTPSWITSTPACDLLQSVNSLPKEVPTCKTPEI